MKILHIIPTLSKGGAERLVVDIIKQLNKQQKTNARLVIFRDEIKYDTSEIKEFISIIPSSVKLSLTKKWIVNVSDLQVYIDNCKPDVIHTHLFEAELVSRFCSYPKALWFSHVHDNMVQFNYWSWSSMSKTNITNWYEKRVLLKQYKKNGGTHFIAISKHTESYIKSVQSNYPVTLLHNAIDVKRFQKPADFQKSSTDNGSSQVENQPPCLPEADNDSPLTINDSPLTTNDSPLTTLSAEADHHSPFTTNYSPFTTHHSPLTINLINIGSFVPKKNQNLLLDIISELVKRNIEVRCFFPGDGPLKIEVEKRARDLGISTHCIFLGNVNDVEEYLWQSHVYVHTATYEPLGLVLIEAMAAGLPVVSLDGGGNRDLMLDGVNGYLLIQQDPIEFADRILEVFQNKEISEFNCTFAKKYDIESYCSKLIEIYKT